MVNSTVLDNGIRVVSELLPEFRSCTLGVWFGTGSRLEDHDQAGLSHFLEHLLFKGTQRRSAYDIAKTMDGIGGQLNAFTEKERTCYYARVVNDHIPLAVDVLFDMISNSLLEEQEIEREKGVILEELKMIEDSPDDLAMHLFNRCLWGSHPLGRPIIGRRQIIGSMQRQQLADYLGQRYVPGNAMVVAAGRVDHESLVRLVREQSQNLGSGDYQPETRPPEALGRRRVFHRDCEQTYLTFGGAGLSATDERRFTLLVLDAVLGSSMSSRLFQEIREKRGLVYTIGTYQSAYRDSGVFGVFAGTSADSAQEVLSLSRAILEQVRSEGITDEELKRAKELIRGNMALAMESTSARMLRLARSMFYEGRHLPVAEALQRVDEVSHDQILKLAGELLNTESYALTVLGPVSEVDGVASEPVGRQALCAHGEEAQTTATV